MDTLEFVSMDLALFILRSLIYFAGDVAYIFLKILLKCVSVISESDATSAKLIS